MSLLQMSFSGAVLIFTIIIIRAVAINKLPKRTFLILWEIALLKLLIPFSVPSVLSIYSLFQRNSTVETLSKAPANVLPYVIPAKQVISTHGTAELVDSSISSVSIWSIIWGIGFVLCLAYFVISYLCCLFKFRTSIPVQKDFVRRWTRVHSLRRAITIRQSDRISAPLTYGILHPVILMPQKTDWDNSTQLQYVLLHEFVHIRYFDAVVKLFSTLALCLHWFNPLVWIMYIFFNRDIELACDETVVHCFGEKSKSTYARTLISMEAEKSGLAPLCNNFSKNAIEERITAIMKTKKTSLLTVLVGAMLIVVVATSCGTSAPTTETETSDPQISESSNIIMPLYPLTSADDALADGGYSVSFTADDFVQNDTGYELMVEVFDYDRYEIADIDKLKVGSQIQFCNKVITVEALEKDTETGYISINGGIENDGIELKEDDGLYRTITIDNYPIYYSVGKVTIPLSDELTFEDHSDMEKEPDGEVFETANAIEAMKKSDISFTCTNTVITVRQEQILQVIRYWVP